MAGSNASSGQGLRSFASLNSGDPVRGALGR
jgi:hypothetical protein